MAQTPETGHAASGRWTKFDVVWMLNLFGTAVGAGILFLPIGEKTLPCLVPGRAGRMDHGTGLSRPSPPWTDHAVGEKKGRPDGRRTADKKRRPAAQGEEQPAKEGGCSDG